MNKKVTLFLTVLMLLSPGITHTEYIENCGSQHNIWRPVQQKARDAVVQIFVQSARFNILRPYETPEQASGAGSGFFINQKGDIITNAHVVDQAVGVWIQIPSLGKRPLPVDVVSVCPERDLALIRLTPESLTFAQSVIGTLPFLPLGDSDTVHRADEVLVLGYPLAQQALKSTKGVISGMEQDMIQMDAAINPGSSGGPMLNIDGEVIGITRCIIMDAQSAGYMIPVNILHIILDDMYENHLLRKPFLGLLTSNATDDLTDYLGNPQPGGCYIVEVIKNSILHKAGLRSSDMIYKINGYRLDIYGELSASWSEDKLSIIDYIARLKIGQRVDLVVYRNGERLDFSFTVTQRDLPPIGDVHPGYEPIDYEIFGGMVIMQLSNNHIRLLAQQAPGLIRYTEIKNQNAPVLVITHVFPNSELYRSRTLIPGVTISEVNGQLVNTLKEFRGAVLAGANQKHFFMRTTDNTSCTTDNLVVALSLEKILQEEAELSQVYRYQVSPLAQELLGQ